MPLLATAQAMAGCPELRPLDGQHRPHLMLSEEVVAGPQPMQDLLLHKSRAVALCTAEGAVQRLGQQQVMHAAWASRSTGMHFCMHARRRDTGAPALCRWKTARMLLCVCVCAPEPPPWSIQHRSSAQAARPSCLPAAR